MHAAAPLRILVVDDDAAYCELLADLLETGGYAVTAVADGASMQRELATGQYALVILDLRLGKEDGMALARNLRQVSAIPLMILSGQADPMDRVIGLELAADDFVLKPIHQRELLARVRALLRRATELSAPMLKSGDVFRHERYTFGEWMVDLTERQLYDSEGRPHSLTLAEFSVLETFLRHPNRIWSRDQLLAQTRSDDSNVLDRTIDVIVSRLRRKIEPTAAHPRYIQTERGVGYRFSATVTRIG